jgi:hypothetical protein
VAGAGGGSADQRFTDDATSREARIGWVFIGWEVLGGTGVAVG